MDTHDPEAELIAAQLKHTITLLEHKIKAQATNLENYRTIANHRIAELEAQAKDYETRLRSLQESSTQFKLLAGLATGGGLVSIISLLRTLDTTSDLRPRSRATQA